MAGYMGNSGNVNENIVHQKYRILTDALNDIWDRVSFWHAAEDIELQNGNNLEADLTNKGTQLNSLFSNFAPTETSPATSAHARGTMLIYNNTLYRVKAAITSGNTLTVGTNIEVATMSTLSEHLVASDGTQFYFDTKDGKYGFYPNASKTASEFIKIT